jgi:hypothetical protein
MKKKHELIMRGFVGWLTVLLLFFAAPAEARWWIFGASPEEISIDYLFLNQSSYDEMGPKVTLFRETLPEGHLEIRGKASVRGGTIAAVRISLDGKATWREAQLSEGGAFLFRFRPEAGKTYQVFVEIMDTRGRTNDIDATRKEVAISEQNIRAALQEVLAGMTEAYRNREVARFMTFVAENFRGDTSSLERAIRKDFSYFDNIDLRITISGMVTDARGQTLVAVNFSRFLVSTRTGRSVNDRGLTEFTFIQGERGPRVLAMKNPLLFGMTDSATLASGTVRQVSADPIIIIDDRGNITKVPADLHARIAGRDGLVITPQPDGTATVKTDEMTVRVNQAGQVVSACGGRAEGETNRQFVVAGHPPTGFTFATGQVQQGAPGDFMATGGDNTKIYVTLAGGVSYRDLGAVGINDVREVPATGYNFSPGMGVYLHQGRTYAFRLANGRFGLLEIRNIIGAFYLIVTFDYKYQPDGSRCF